MDSSDHNSSMCAVQAQRVFDAISLADLDLMDIGGGESGGGSFIAGIDLAKAISTADVRSLAAHMLNK